MCNLVRKVTHTRKRTPWVDRDQLLHRHRGPRRNHLCQFLWLPHAGFRRGGVGVKFWVLHWLASSRLQHSRTTVRMCDITCWKVTVIARPSKCRCVRLRTRMNLLNLHYELSLFDIATHSMTICTGHSSSFLPGGCSGPVGRVSDS